MSIFSRSRTIFIHVFSLVGVLFFGVPFVFGAELFFEVKNAEYGVNQLVDVGVFLDTEGEDINAVEGVFVFPPEFLTVRDIHDVGSVINFWVEKPRVSNGESLSFSGIVPGGYSSGRGLLFVVRFFTHKEGDIRIHFDSARLLKNDGLGTATDTTLRQGSFVVRVGAPLVEEDILAQTVDTSIPEDFVPIVTRDPLLFDGQWFVVFATQDKGSGMSHFEIKEGNKPFVIAESPYLLQNQSLDKEISIRAIDRNNNVRIVTIPPQYTNQWYYNYYLFGILIATLLSYLFWKILWRRNYV